MSEHAKQFAIQKIYIKEVSFEAPNTPTSFTLDGKPKVDIQLGNNTQHIADTLYEVSLKVTVVTRIETHTLYMAEVTQAGVFTLDGFADEEIEPMLRSFCSSILFPYLREAVSDLVTRGGFPPMILEPVNFDALYMQHQQHIHPEGLA